MTSTPPERPTAIARDGVLGRPVPIPHGLDWWRATAAGAAWLDRLPALVEASVAAWHLDLDAPFAPASVAWVAPARLPGGQPVVLKLNFPEPESEPEAAALLFWGGVGAVALIDESPEHRALLLARCRPGEPLTSRDEDVARTISASVLRVLWRPAPENGTFPRLEDASVAWAQELPVRWERLGRPCQRNLIEQAVGLAIELADSQPEQVLCHQDAHGANILSCAPSQAPHHAGGIDPASEGWLAIDPKPIIGERAFDLASPLRDRRPALRTDPRPARTLARRLDGYVADLGVDRERARGWAIVHALAWGLSDEATHADLITCAEIFAAL